VGEQVNQQAGIFGLEGPDSDLQAVFCVEGVDYVVQSSYSWENLQRISRMRRIIDWFSFMVAGNAGVVL
jgi:hypothetical protein